MANAFDGKWTKKKRYQKKREKRNLWFYGGEGDDFGVFVWYSAAKNL